MADDEQDYVEIQYGAFLFCRWTVALLLWVSLLTHSISLVVLVFLILLASAALQVHRAPLVVLFSQTIGRVRPTELVTLEAPAMQFAHALGAALAMVCLLALQFAPHYGWEFVLVFAALKSVAACGFCPASKLYRCATGGNCCAFLKRH